MQKWGIIRSHSNDTYIYMFIFARINNDIIVIIMKKLSLLLLILSCSLFGGCSDEEETGLDAIIENNSDEVRTSNTGEGETVGGPMPGYIDQSLAIKSDFRGTWKVSGDNIKEQIVTLTGEPVTNVCVSEEGGEGYAFPSNGIMRAYGHTMYIYLQNTEQYCLEKDLFAVYEVVSMENGKSVLNIHGGPGNSSLDDIIYLEKVEGDTDFTGNYNYPMGSFSQNDLLGSWMLTKQKSLFSGKESEFENPESLIVTFNEDGSIDSSTVNWQLMQGNGHVYYFGRSFLLYNETLDLTHPWVATISLYEVESVNEEELVLSVWPVSLSGLTECQLFFKRI